MRNDNTFEEYNGPMISDFEDAQAYEQSVRYQRELNGMLNQILDADGMNDLEQELDEQEANERLEGMAGRSLDEQSR